MKRILPILVLAACSDGAAPGSGPVTLAIEAGTIADCQAFCADVIGAIPVDIETGKGIAPEKSVPCGQDLLFDGIRAGERLRVRAWAARGGARLLEGESSPITVPAADLAVVKVYLAPIAAPAIESVEPLALSASPGSESAFKVKGSGFGKGEGVHGLFLDGVPLAVTSWSDGEILAVAKPGDSGLSLAASDCGVSSAAVPVRFLASDPKVVAIGSTGCVGFEFVASSSLPGGDCLLAVACPPPTPSYLQRMVAGGCKLSSSQVTLAGRPFAIAATPDGKAAWVVLDDGQTAFQPLDLSLAEPGPKLTAPSQVAASGKHAWVVAGAAGGSRELLRLDKGGAKPVEGLEVEAVAATGGLVVAAAVQGAGRHLLEIDEEGMSATRDWPLPGCEGSVMVGLASDASFAVVPCGGGVPGLFVVRPAVEGSSQFVPSAAGSAPALVTVDAAGAIGFAWAGAGGGTGSISATFLPEGRHLGAWPIALEADPTFVAVMAGGRFLLAGGGGGKGNLAAISLYGQADPCSLE